MLFVSLIFGNLSIKIEGANWLLEMNLMNKYFALFLAGSLSLAGVLTAQTTNGLVISTSTEAVGIHYNNQMGAGNITSVSLDLVDWGSQKGNSLSVADYTLLATTGGFSSYLGGIHVVPDISGLVKHTNLASDQLGVFGEAAAGNSTFSGSTSNEFTFLVGGGVNYRLTPNIAWSTVDYRWGRIGAQNYYTVSSGLVYYFNPSASRSLAIKRMSARARVKAQVKAQEDAAAAAIK